MSMTSGGKAVSAEINVTPLIDVLLVLLIIFMVIVPMAPSGLSAAIPQPNKSTTPMMDPAAPIVVQVQGDADHGITYKINEVLLERSDVEQKLAEVLAMRSDKTMFIKGDAGLEYSEVASVIDSAHHAGAGTIGIITPRDR
jgi:biopolymer transport protein TolR